MQVWRLAKPSRPTFDGEGARLYGGRWNHPGVAVIYTSAFQSLAILEYFVHLDIRVAPKLVMLRAEIPDAAAILRVERAHLPADWRQTPAPVALANFGSAWARQGATAVLAVPSVIVPAEYNYILNPAHPDFDRMRVARPAPFSLDARILKPAPAVKRTRRRHQSGRTKQS